MEKLYIGIDPGAKGAIAVINQEGKIISMQAVPLIKDEIDYNKLKDIFVDLSKNDNIHLCIEDVHSIFGVSAAANFSFGHMCGFLNGMIVYSKIPYTMVQPKTWQKEIWSGFKPVEVNTGKTTAKGSPKMKVDTKATSLIVANRLFPSADFRKSERSTKAHDGIVDAVLLAEYCRRKIG